MLFCEDFTCFTLFVLLFEVQTSTSQFPKHLDLQKVGEIKFNGEKFNVLKPSIHTITDYFKHFMLGEIRRYPNERVFIDDNGFRHDWSYFEKPSRKHYLIQNPQTLKEIKVNLTDHKTITVKETTEKSKVRKKPRRKKKVIEEEVKKETPKDDRNGLREGEKTVAQTTFFCPFFGVITMSSYLE